MHLFNLFDPHAIGYIQQEPFFAFLREKFQ